MFSFIRVSVVMVSLHSKRNTKEDSKTVRYEPYLTSRVWWELLVYRLNHMAW